MFTKANLVALLLSSASLALASPAKRAGTGSVNLVNHTPGDIPFAVIAEKNPTPVVQGTLAASQTTNLPMSPDMSGLSVKLAGPGGNPQSSSGILQFEYTYNSTNDNSVSYDWSCVNCNPDPFSQFQRTIQPGQPGGGCVPITCNAGEDDVNCEFIASTAGPVKQCPDFDGVVLTATIG